MAGYRNTSALIGTLRQTIGFASVLVGAVAVASPVWADRHALILSNADYSDLPDLQNTHADASAYADVFSEFGYDVTRLQDLNLDDTLHALDVFLSGLLPGDEVVLVYSGHGWSDGSTNYLIPTDAPLEGSDRILRRNTLALQNGSNGLLDEFKSAGVRLSVAIMDACRNNPFKPPEGARSVAMTKGLARITPRTGSFVILSAGAGQEALDRLPDDPADQTLSVFTRSFLPYLRAGHYLEDAVSRAQLETAELARRAGGHIQHPAYYDEALGPTCLADSCVTRVSATSDPDTSLMAERDELRNDNKKLTDRLRAMEDREAKQSEALETLQRRITGLESDLKDATRTLERRDQVMSDLRQKLADAMSGGIQRGDDRRVLEEQLAAALAAKLSAEAEMDTVRDQLAAALAAKSAAEDEVANAQSRLAQTLADLGDPSADLKTLTKERDELHLRLLVAQEALGLSEDRVSEAHVEIAALHALTDALRVELANVQTLLDDAGAREAAYEAQLQTLGSELNIALALVAAEERNRRKLEEEHQRLLEREKALHLAETARLETSQSFYFSRLKELLHDQDGVRVDGERFVFSSEALFKPGSADLSAAGRREIAKVARAFQSIAPDIPEDIDWFIRVDGHTDTIPLRSSATFADNWELSQARALSVVRDLITSYGIPPQRLAANGFGQYQPLNAANTAKARAQNRRIEISLSER